MDYRMQHQAPTAETTSATLHDLTPVFGEDAYTHPDWFGGTDEYADGVRVVQEVRGNPDARVTIYRALPPDVPRMIHRGDWVTISRAYAESHAIQDDNPENDWPVIRGTVEARTLYNDGGSILEYGYDGELDINPLWF